MLKTHDYIDPTVSLRANLDNARIIKLPVVAVYDSFNDMPLKDVDKEMLIECERHVKNVPEKAIIRDELERRELVHMIDDLKLSLENGLVHNGDVRYLKQQLMTMFDSMYEKEHQITSRQQSYYNTFVKNLKKNGTCF